MLIQHATGVCFCGNGRTKILKNDRLITIPKAFVHSVGDLLIFPHVNEIEIYSIHEESVIGQIKLNGDVVDIAFLENSIVVLFKDKIVHYDFSGNCIERFAHHLSHDTITAIDDGFILSETWSEMGISVCSINPIRVMHDNLSPGYESLAPSVVVSDIDNYYIGGMFCLYALSKNGKDVRVLDESVLLVSDIVVHKRKLFVSSCMIGDYAPSPLGVYDIEKEVFYTITESDDGRCCVHEDTVFIWNDTGFKNGAWTRGCDWVAVLQGDGSVKTIWTDPMGSQQYKWSKIFCLGDSYYLLVGSKGNIVLEQSTCAVVLEQALDGWDGIEADGQVFWLWNEHQIESYPLQSFLNVLGLS